MAFANRATAKAEAEDSMESEGAPGMYKFCTGTAPRFLQVDLGSNAGGCAARRRAVSASACPAATVSPGRTARDAKVPSGRGQTPRPTR
ncbi:hypothetical protein AB0J72_05210 [Dactylosporangium sp. NPDC049742]|uniref:hypothetical protein n=1 Tax=Dactylosporangium sp. NPDC049742 TaxID=3154737 RepID=UPI00343F5BD9